MNPRLAVLYARSRGVPLAAALLVGVSIVGALVGSYLAGRPNADSTARLPVVVGAAMLAAFVLGSTLASPVREIEDTTPRPWSRWRASHTVLAAVVAAAVLVPALSTGEYGAGALLRNAVGLWGLGLLAAVGFGAQLAWTLPLVHGLTVYVVGGGVGGGRGVWAFILAPASSVVAMTTALVLLAVGVSAWAWYPHG